MELLQQVANGSGVILGHYNDTTTFNCEKDFSKSYLKGNCLQLIHSAFLVAFMFQLCFSWAMHQSAFPSSTLPSTHHCASASTICRWHSCDSPTEKKTSLLPNSYYSGAENVSEGKKKGPRHSFNRSTTQFWKHQYRRLENLQYFSLWLHCYKNG